MRVGATVLAEALLRGAEVRSRHGPSRSVGVDRERHVGSDVPVEGRWNPPRRKRRIHGDIDADGTRPGREHREALVHFEEERSPAPDPRRFEQADEPNDGVEKRRARRAKSPARQIAIASPPTPSPRTIETRWRMGTFLQVSEARNSRVSMSPSSSPFRERSIRITPQLGQSLRRLTRVALPRNTCS